MPVAVPVSPEGNRDAFGMIVQLPWSLPDAAGCFPLMTMILMVPTAAEPSVARQVRPLDVCDVVIKLRGVAVSIILVSLSDANAMV